ncbi:MAG TPA: DUF1549 domain-containing protein [Pirellulales bacterium]|nr:DUF1549 domain-containing protein [Pirellulales bacterium]
MKSRSVSHTLAAAAVAALVLGGAVQAALAAEGAAASAETALEPIVVGTPEKIEVYPPSFKLGSTRARMHVVVSGYYAGGAVQDLTRAAEFASTNEGVVKIVGGTAVPVANGQAEVVCRVAGQELKVPVEVAGQEAAERVSFNYGTLAALSKQGCNSGACHGSPSGKGGFRMSLRAYDPTVDMVTLVRESFNRRTNAFEPENSLLLKKPLMEVAHGGGRRIRKGDPSYAILRDWIAQGCQVDPPEAPTCVKVEVYPRQRILNRPAHTQQLHVLAHFSDGTVRDITDLAAFSSSDEAVATVDANGLVVGHDRGEAAILVRYLEKIETAYLMFLKEVPGFAWNNPPEQNYVDKFVFEKLRQLQILPSDLCSDEEFVRRVYLDVIGELPTVSEAEAFLASQDPQKRAALINALLERPEYADFWALKWSDLLRLRNNKVTPAGVHKFYRWVVNALRTNMPYDRFVRELLTSAGSTFDHPAANYFRTATDTNDCTETTSQLFLGIRIQCAKCHNHPFERWTQDNYYGIGAFFNRVQRKPSARPEEQVVFVARAGEVTQPRTGKQMKPWLPLTGDADLPGEDDRRQTFVDWLVKADNPFFAKVEVNRLWGHLLGRGIVEPVDDFRDSNPPASAALLEALAQDFAAHGFDRKHILRTILNSRTYQLSSRKNEFNKSDAKYFSHARTRLLSAEQLLDAICQVTSVPEKYAGLPAGTRATQLPSPDVDNYFLKVFGQPARETACQCERSNESNLSQALQMINGPLVHSKVRDENNRLKLMLKAQKSTQDVITELYLAAFCRKPSDAEMTTAANHVVGSGDQVKGLEDVCWALLNANEFLFQH